MKRINRCLALALAMLLAMGAMGALAATKAVELNKNNFPDAKFLKIVRDEFDSNNDGKLTASEIKKAKGLWIYGQGISNLKGVEYLTSLTDLNCGGNKLTKLDVSKNTKLEALSFDGNKKLTSVKLGKLTKLASLSCENCTKLTSLDIGGCKKLVKAVKSQLASASSKIATYGSDGERPVVTAGAKLKLMNGKTLLRSYAKPTAISLSKKTATMHMGNEFVWSEFDVFIKTTPATAVYPIKISSSNQNVVDTYYDYFYGLSEGESTLTVSCGKATATLKVTVEY